MDATTSFWSAPPKVCGSRSTTSRQTGASRLQRVHGGVPALALFSGMEDPFNQRRRAHVTAKRAIVRHVAAGAKPGDSLFINTGATTICPAEERHRVKGLIIIMNSPDIACLAARGEGARVMRIGGEFRRAGREPLGAMALAQIGQLHGSEAILTVAGVTPDGAMDLDPQEAEVACTMGRSGVLAVAPLAALTRIVTDAMPQTLCRAVKVTGPAVEIAKM